MTHQIGTKQEVREKARKALTDYFTMFIPGSWKEPLDKIKLLLQANEDVDWEALKGHALLYFDEQRLSEDRVECLARVERLSDTFKGLAFYILKEGNNLGVFTPHMHSDINFVDDFSRYDELP